MQPWLAKEMKHPKMRMYLFQRHFKTIL